MMVTKFRIHGTQISAVLLGIIVFLSGSTWEREYPILSTLLYFVGCVLAGIGSIGRLWCSLYIAGYKTQKLITEGPYSMSRHPLYFFSLLGAVGFGLATESLLITLIILVSFSLYYPRIIANEDNKLKLKHGQTFVTYKERVPCFFPKMTNLSEPEEYIVKPMIFRKHMISALWFVWLIGILELIQQLHATRIIPILFRIY
jgi:protein-S-isoprenylcysteine O-methyltransferase Ste14